MRKESLIPLLLAIVTFGVYFQTRDFDFVQYDDFLYVVNNQLISEGFSPDAVVESFKTIQVSNWHPVTWLSHMLDVEVFGVDPGPHHLVNVVLHVLNTVLLFALLFSITRQIWPTTIVAALFALHPMHVESVAWISERKDLLCAFFWLLATAAYVRYTEKQVNEILKRYSDDTATLRRGFVEYKMMAREGGGGAYWLTEV